MSIVDVIQQLPVNTVQVDDNYNRLKASLDEYHSLVQSGKLVPRGNNVPNIYTTLFYKSNINAKECE